MRNYKIFIRLLLTLTVLMLLFSACKKKDEPVFIDGGVSTEPTYAWVQSPAPESPSPAAIEPSAEPSPEPPVSLNPLTGLKMREEAVGKRPYAFVINNRKPSLPQYGIGQADIIYEVLSESSITRMIAFFQDPQEEKIGSIRSARDYFIYFAWDHDAIFVHHGGSPQAYGLIRTKQIDDIDGMDFDGTVFKRDPDRWAIPFNREDSSFTAASRVIPQAQKFNYRIESNIENEAFDFYDTYTKPFGGAAKDITINHHSGFMPYFTWDKQSALYARYEFDEPQIDAATGEQLKFTNIVVQKVTMHIISGDKEGRRVVDLVGSGDGLLFTAGRVMYITWEKKDKATPTQWYDAYGNKLTLNKGKTWICVTANDPTYQ